MLPEFVSWRKKTTDFFTSREERFEDERRCTNPLMHRNVEVQFTVLIFICFIQSPLSGSVMTRS